jgi:signal peptidase II
VRFGNYHYPAFNVADSAIAIGAALIILDVLLTKHHAHEVSKHEAH